MNFWKPILHNTCRRQHGAATPPILASVVTLSVRYMSKYLSKSATKRLPLTTKRARKGYYKGKGGTKEGRLTSKGKFIVDPSKRLQLIVPDLEGFKVNHHNDTKFIFGVCNFVDEFIGFVEYIVYF
jgi:hypothetical protein